MCQPLDIQLSTLCQYRVPANQKHSRIRGGKFLMMEPLTRGVSEDIWHLFIILRHERLPEDANPHRYTLEVTEDGSEPESVTLNCTEPWGFIKLADLLPKGPPPVNFSEYCISELGSCSAGFSVTFSGEYTYVSDEGGQCVRKGKHISPDLSSLVNKEFKAFVFSLKNSSQYLGRSLMGDESPAGSNFLATIGNLRCILMRILASKYLQPASKQNLCNQLKQEYLGRFSLCF